MSRVIRAAIPYLRRDVAWSAPRASVQYPRTNLCYAKVNKDYVAGLGDHDVVRLDVTVEAAIQV